MISKSVKLVDGHPEVVATTDINLVAAATAALSLSLFPVTSI
jgi:hypothetical protein